MPCSGRAQSAAPGLPCSDRLISPLTKGTPALPAERCLHGKPPFASLLCKTLSTRHQEIPEQEVRLPDATSPGGLSLPGPRTALEPSASLPSRSLCHQPEVPMAKELGWAL